MDQFTILRNLDKLGNAMRRFGLSPLPRIGKNILKPLVGNSLSVNVDGFDLSGFIEQRHYLHSLQKGLMEACMVDLFRNVVKPGMLVLDIGGFLGWYTLFAARQVGTSGRVFVFEPDPRNYSLLTQNVRRNGLGDRVIALPDAVSDTTGVKPFFLHGGSQSRSSFAASLSEVTKINVKCVMLDEYFNESMKVDVIKMDIEGSEMQALRGMERTLSRGHDKLTMFVECNPSALRRAGDSARVLIARLRELEFTVNVIDEKNRRLIPVDSSIETVKHVNLYCRRNYSPRQKTYE
jgi:FkbM family methyltransferase